MSAQNYNLPKVAILMLRGLEGCGVTNYARHMQAFFHQEDSVCDIFALMKITKSHIGRPDTSKDIDFISFIYEERAEIVDRLNEYDLVLLFSVPPKSAYEAVQTYVEDILEQISKPLIFINHDHHLISFSRNMRYKDAIEACDKVLCHSLQDTSKGFVTWVKKHDVKAKLEKLPIFYHVPLLEDYITFTKDGREKTAIQPGRYSSWKRTTLYLDLHQYLRKKDFYTVAIGLERSPGMAEKFEFYKDLGWDFWTGELPDGTKFKRPSDGALARKNKKLLDWLAQGNKDVSKFYSIGPYGYYDGMETIKSSAFAFHCRSFERSDLDYGNNPEFQTLECALLSIPVIHRHFAETVTLPDTDIRLIDRDEFLIIDDGGLKPVSGQECINGDELVEKMDSIWNDSELYEKQRQAAVDLVHDHYSTDIIIPKLIQKCLE